MKRTMTIGLLGAILAVAVGFISTNAISATPFLMAASDVSSDESAYMIGHVEYTVRGADGQIKQYVQGDNLIVDRGRDCSAQKIFEDDATTVCSPNGNGFNFIAIGNGTHVDDNSQLQLVDSTGTGPIYADADGCDGDSTTDDTCEMQRTPATVTINSASGSTVVSVATTTPFSFDHGDNNGAVNGAIEILESGLFDDSADFAGNMFSARSVTGISVTNADTLAVTWTITLS